MRLSILIIFISFIQVILAQNKGTNTISICTEMRFGTAYGKILKSEQTRAGDTALTTLEGSLVNSIGEKIKNEVITLKTGGRSLMTISDSHGDFKIVMRSGIYNMYLKPFGYRETKLGPLFLQMGKISKLLISVGEFCCVKTEYKPKDSVNIIETRLKQKDDLYAEEKRAKRYVEDLTPDLTSKQPCETKIILTSEQLIKFAEPILFKKYGEKQIVSERPYHVFLFNDLWVIYGTLNQFLFGGVFVMLVDACDPQIHTFFHEK